MKKWKVNTMNYDRSIRFNAEKEIRENLGSRGHWKQSIVCKIRFYGCYTMTDAWSLLNEILFTISQESKPQMDMHDYICHIVDNYSPYKLLTEQ